MSATPIIASAPVFITNNAGSCLAADAPLNRVAEIVNPLEERD